MKDLYPSWSMNGVGIDDVEDIMYPVVSQPKLNGVRAKWDCKEQLFISRQGKPWRRELLPHLYQKLEPYPTTSFDGELYCHGMKFQDICARVSVNRLDPHPDIESINFHAFDVIGPGTTKDRLEQLEQYPTIVPWMLLNNHAEVNSQLTSMRMLGYEGLILRQLGVPYINGKTEAIIKVKPWIIEEVIIQSCVEGTGKWSNALGAFWVKNSKDKRFKVGGGNVTEHWRRETWEMKNVMLGLPITIRYRELTNKGIPSQPQIYQS